ncbi:MAG: hypothetical protein ACO1RX_11865 [Candidatus Sericytochromatia bacterium]
MSKPYVLARPILPGQLEAWKKLSHELQSTYKADYDAVRQKAGVLREVQYHQASPQGDLAVTYLELEHGMGRFNDELRAIQDTPFGQYFSAQLSHIHGHQLGEAPADNAQALDWLSPSLFDKVGQTASSIGQNVFDTAQSLLHKAGENSGGVGQQVAHTASELAHKAQDLTHKAQEITQEIRHKAEAQTDVVRQNLTATTSALLDHATHNSAEVSKVVQEKAGELIDKAHETTQQLMHQAKSMLGIKADKSDDDPKTGDKA